MAGAGLSGIGQRLHGLHTDTYLISTMYMGEWAGILVLGADEVVHQSVHNHLCD